MGRSDTLSATALKGLTQGPPTRKTELNTRKASGREDASEPACSISQVLQDGGMRIVRWSEFERARTA